MRMQRTMGLALMAALLGAFIIGTAGAAASNGATVVRGGAFYVDGTLYRTVLTPTDLSHTGAPDHSFDVIYDIADHTNVAEAAPGDRDYNGGRWMVIGVVFDDYATAAATYGDQNGVIDSAEEVEEAIAAGAAIASDTGIRFNCPVIPL